MDVFLSTFHNAAEAGSVSAPAANRCLSTFRNCVDHDDPAILVARCAPQSFLLLTQRRVVVLRQAWPLRRLTLHLNANLRHLSHVTWRLDESKPGIELAATAVDGVRERFRMRLGDVAAVWRVEEVLRAVFQGRREPVAVPARRLTAAFAS